jgi:hypothetical protein
MDVTSNDCLSLSYHVDANHYEVPLIVSFQVEMEGYHTKKLYITENSFVAGGRRLRRQLIKRVERRFSTTPFTFSPLENGQHAIQTTDLAIDNLASTFFLNFNVN